jgi:hypothetical protein
MTDLLRPVRRPAVPSSDDGGRRRPLAAEAALAGVGSPAVVILLLWALGLVGWFAADGGSHGSTRSVLRVASDGWLLAHGAHLTLDGAVVTASPLGLTVACAYVTFRFGSWAGATAPADDLRTAGLGAVVLAGVYAVVALLVSLMAAVPTAEPGLGLSFLGGAAMGGAAGGMGLVRGAGLGSALRRRLPVPVLSAGMTALGVVVAMVGTGAVLTATALAFRISAATEVADQLDLDAAGWAFSLVLLAAILPNVSLLASSYLAGPGFALGAGTVVAPTEVATGPVPSLPVLAALPSPGWTPEWLVVLLAVPVLAGATAAYLSGRVLPTGSYQTGVARGLGGGLLGALALSLLVVHAGGGIGPGRMAEIGADLWPLLASTLVSIGIGGGAGGLGATWRTRRRTAEPTSQPTAPQPADTDLSTEETVRLGLPPAR